MYIFAKLLFLIVMISASTAYSQVDSTETLFYRHSVQRSLDYLTDTLEAGSNLYNGIEHSGYFRGIKGFAYFESDKMIKGSVKYDGVWYTIPMQYDMYAEKLVITHFNKLYNVSLVNEKIEEFVLYNHIFRNFSITETGKVGLSGMCEVLYEGGSMSIYAKKKKLLNERSTSQGLEREFIKSFQYYVRLNGAFHQIKSKGEMLGLMGEKRKDLVTRLRHEKIKFRKNKEEALIIASKVYDEKI